MSVSFWILMVLVGIIVLLGLVLLVASLPDLKRYLHIHRM